MSPFKCRACLKESTSAADYETHKGDCRKNLFVYLKIEAIGLDPDDTETQERLGLRYDFTPDLKNKRQDEWEYLGYMKRQLNDWGAAPLTEEFVSELEKCIAPDELEWMREEAVSDLRRTSNKGSLPIFHNRMPWYSQFKCRACSRGYKSAAQVRGHRLLCHANREAYLKVKALGLRLGDTEAQEKLWIRFAPMQNRRGLRNSEALLLENMRSQLKAWGKAPLTEEFMSNLGHSSNLELLERRNMKKRTISNRDFSGDLDDRNTSKKRSLLESDTTLPRKRNHTSGPLLLESLPGPSSKNTVRNQTSANPPSLDDAISQDRRQPTAVNEKFTEKFTNGMNFSLEDSSPVGHGSARFDAAFASWLEGEKISKAAIGRLVKDPTLQPLTGLMTRDYMESLETNSGAQGEDEDEELVSRICGMPLSEIFV